MSVTPGKVRQFIDKGKTPHYTAKVLGITEAEVLRALELGGTPYVKPRRMHAQNNSKGPTFETLPAADINSLFTNWRRTT